MVVATYYFDGSDASNTDPNGVWTNDANAFDGSTATSATTSASGSVSLNYLMAEGTDAPGSGGEITQVRARIYGRSEGLTLNAVIYTDGLAESLGNPSRSGVAGWSSYVTLSTPTGGWSWPVLQSLEVKIYDTQPSANTEAYRVEVEVTSAEPPTPVAFLTA